MACPSFWVAANIAPLMFGWDSGLATAYIQLLQELTGQPLSNGMRQYSLVPWWDSGKSAKHTHTRARVRTPHSCTSKQKHYDAFKMLHKTMKMIGHWMECWFRIFQWYEHIDTIKLRASKQPSQRLASVQQNSRWKQKTSQQQRSTCLKRPIPGN